MEFCLSREEIKSLHYHTRKRARGRGELERLPAQAGGGVSAGGLTWTRSERRMAAETETDGGRRREGGKKLHAFLPKKTTSCVARMGQPMTLQL